MPRVDFNFSQVPSGAVFFYHLLHSAFLLFAASEDIDREGVSSVLGRCDGNRDDNEYFSLRSATVPRCDRITRCPSLAEAQLIRNGKNDFTSHNDPCSKLSRLTAGAARNSPQPASVRPVIGSRGKDSGAYPENSTMRRTVVEMWECSLGHTQVTFSATLRRRKCSTHTIVQFGGIGDGEETKFQRRSHRGRLVNGIVYRARPGRSPSLGSPETGISRRLAMLP